MSGLKVIKIAERLHMVKLNNVVHEEQRILFESMVVYYSHLLNVVIKTFGKKRSIIVVLFIENQDQ